MNDYYLEPETLERLQKYQSLLPIVNATRNEMYDTGYLSPLTQWFRGRFENDQARLVEEILEWDDDTLEDFYSWGHNSRWHHTFENEMFSNFDAYVNTAMDIEDGEYD